MNDIVKEKNHEHEKRPNKCTAMLESVRLRKPQILASNMATEDNAANAIDDLLAKGQPSLIYSATHQMPAN